MVAEAFLGMALQAAERAKTNVATLHCGKCEVPLECMADRISVCISKSCLTSEFIDYNIDNSCLFLYCEVCGTNYPIYFPN